MYELYMKKAYKVHLESEDENYEKDRRKGHLQYEALYQKWLLWRQRDQNQHKKYYLEGGMWVLGKSK